MSDLETSALVVAEADVLLAQATQARRRRTPWSRRLTCWFRRVWSRDDVSVSTGPTRGLRGIVEQLEHALAAATQRKSEDSPGLHLAINGDKITIPWGTLPRFAAWLASQPECETIGVQLRDGDWFLIPAHLVPVVRDRVAEVMRMQLRGFRA